MDWLAQYLCDGELFVKIDPSRIGGVMNIEDRIERIYKLTEVTQQQRTDRLATEFMGWTFTIRGWRVKGKVVARNCWDPFTSLDDARLLLDECERRGLLEVLSYENYDYNAEAPWLAFKQGLMRKATEITEAVWAVAELGE